MACSRVTATNGRLIFTRCININPEPQLTSSVPNARIKLRSGQTHRGIHLKIRNIYGQEISPGILALFYIELNKRCDRLWELATEAMDLYSSSGNVSTEWKVEYYIPTDERSRSLPGSAIHSKWPENTDETAYLVQLRQSNTPLFRSLTPDGDTRLLIGLSFASIIYGGLHLVAWSAPFATPKEQVLWRLSALTVAVGMPTASLVIPLLEFLEKGLMSTMFGDILLVFEILILVLLMLLALTSELKRNSIVLRVSFILIIVRPREKSCSGLFLSAHEYISSVYFLEQTFENIFFGL